MRTIHAVLGDYYHCSDHLLNALRSTSLPADVSLAVTRYPDPVDPPALAGHHLLFLSTMGKWSPRTSDEMWFDSESQQALSDHVFAGAGLVVFHSGTASHPPDGPLRALCGGRFLHHPPEHPEVTVSVLADHPITSGVSSFTHPDEHYFVEIDPDVTPLLSAVSSLGEQSAGWCRTHGSGRVAVIVPGHTPAMLEEPNLHRLLTNAITWALSDES